MIQHGSSAKSKNSKLEQDETNCYTSETRIVETSNRMLTRPKAL